MKDLILVLSKLKLTPLLLITVYLEDLREGSNFQLTCQWFSLSLNIKKKTRKALFSFFCLTSWKHRVNFVFNWKRGPYSFPFTMLHYSNPFFNLKFASRFDYIWYFYHKLLQITFGRRKNTHTHIYTHVQTNECCRISLNTCRFSWMNICSEIRQYCVQ